MPVLDRKSRMVSFRLSSAEYHAAVNTCHAQGFRSMSLYARSALLAFESSPDNCIPRDAEITEIRLRLEFLTLQIQRIAATVAVPSEDSLSGPVAADYLASFSNGADQT
jgi:hypothetical protein